MISFIRHRLQLSVPGLVIKKTLQPESLKFGEPMVKVLMYTWAMCPFCIAAKQLLDDKHVLYEEKVIDNDPEGWEEMQQRTQGAQTVPQIFIDDVLIGGFTDLRSLEMQGRLDALLTKQG